MHLRRACLLLAISAASVATAADVELALTSGRTLRGEVVSEVDGNVVLRLRQPVRGGVKEIEITCQRGDIMKRKELPGAAQLYAERKQRTPDTIPEQCTLAQWCYENCLREQARDHAVHVLDQDPENAWAQRILDNCGYLAVDGKWVDEAEYLKASNKTKVDGKVVSLEYAEVRKALAKAVAARDRAIAARDAARTGVAAHSGTANEAKLKQLLSAVEAAKKAVDAADKKLAAVNAEPAGRGDAAEARQKRLIAARAELADLQQKLVEANRQVETAKGQVNLDKGLADQAKSQLPDLEAAATKAIEEVRAAAAKLPADDAAAVSALADAPKTDAPKTGASKTDPPRTDQPKVDDPKPEGQGRRHGVR